MNDWLVALESMVAALDPDTLASNATARPRDGSQSVLYDSLARFDFATGERCLYTLPRGDVVSEPVSVPRARMPPRVTGGCWQRPGVSRSSLAS